MYEAEIDEAIKQLQAGSTRAPGDLSTLALSPACTLERYHLIVSAFYAVLDGAHLERSKMERSLPLQQALCLTSLASVIPGRFVCSGPQGTLQTLALHWHNIYRWILYLKTDFVDQESVVLSFRLLARRCIADFLALCDDAFLDYMFDPVVQSPGIIATLVSLWHLEVKDKRFSLSDDPSSCPKLHITSTLDSCMCAFSQREKWDWSEILRPFDGSAEALATAALEHLRQDVTRTPINYDLVVWDIHLITTFSINDDIRMSFLHQSSMTLVTSVISSLIDQYATIDQRTLVAKAISYGYWYIRAYVECTEGIPWVTQTIEAGLLSAMPSTEPWIKHLNGQQSEDWEPLFLLLGQIIPKYSVYSSVLKTMIRRLTAIDAGSLQGKLQKEGLLFQSWSLFEHIVRGRAALFNMSLSNETHIESCQNVKCDKSGPPGSFKSCAGCLHVHYCSKECQVYDWKHGHQQYCRDIQVRRANGLMSRLSKRNIHFIDRVITHDLSSFRERIQASVTLLNLNPVVVELDYTEVPMQVDVGSLHTMAALKTCACDVAVSQKWDYMVELAQKSATKKILVRAFLPAGTSVRVKLQCLPLKRILEDHAPVTDEEPAFDFDETFDLLYSRAGQSFGIVDAAFPNEAMRAMKEKMTTGGREISK